MKSRGQKTRKATETDVEGTERLERKSHPTSVIRTLEEGGRAQDMNGGTEGRRDGGTEGRRDGGTEGRRDGGTE